MTTLDPERQGQAREYARINRRMWALGAAFAALYALVWLVTGWSALLRQRLSPALAAPAPAGDWLVVLGYAAAFGGIYFVLNLPLDYYTGFVLPHRFDQSNQSLKDWFADQLKGLAVGAPLGLLLLELLYLLLRAAGDGWWLWAAGGLLLFNVLLANLAPILIMPLFNKFVPLGEEHQDLAERLMKLAERAHAKVKGVFKFDMTKRTKAANAALTGIGNTRRIVLGDTLINEFTPDEIETVLAHELGHHVHRDIPFLIAFGLVTTLPGFYLASLGLHWATTRLGLAGAGDIAALPALGLILGGYSLVSMPLENAVLRCRERMADHYALESTGKGQAFASAFIRLANQNLGEVDPEQWVVFLFHSHPPLAERIETARKWKT